MHSPHPTRYQSLSRPPIGRRHDAMRAGITPARSMLPASGALRAAAIGALALGAFAIGALAIGRLAVGSLSIGRTRLRRLEVDDLVVKRLRVGDLEITRRSADASGRDA